MAIEVASPLPRSKYPATAAETSGTDNAPYPKPPTSPNRIRNCHSSLISDVAIMATPRTASPPAKTQRGPYRSIKFPASGETTPITASTTEPPLDVSVRAQPSSNSHVGIRTPTDDRAENTRASAKKLVATTPHP